MKLDVVGEYVADIIDREKDAPRSLPNGSLTKLYFLPPNSRYAFFCGLVFIAMEGLFFFFRLQRVRYADSTSTTVIMLLVGLFLIPLAFAWPLAGMRRIKHAIEIVVNTIWTVDSVRIAGDKAHNTYEGMTNGAIRAEISYTVNG